MTGLRMIAIGLALLLAMAGVLQVALSERRAADARVNDAEQVLRRRESELAAIRQALVERRQAEAQLREAYERLGRLAAQRQHLIEELTHANAELASWAEQPVPDMARRLHHRPEIHGATAYGEWLSGRGALHP